MVLICGMINVMENPTTNNNEINTSDLSLYLELGHTAAAKGDSDEAKNWYSIGLKVAQKCGDIISEKQFSRFLITLF